MTMLENVVDEGPPTLGGHYTNVWTNTYPACQHITFLWKLTRLALQSSCSWGLRWQWELKAVIAGQSRPIQSCSGGVAQAELASTSIKEKGECENTHVGVEYCICPNICIVTCFIIFRYKSRRDYPRQQHAFKQHPTLSSGTTPLMWIWRWWTQHFCFIGGRKERGESSSAGVSSATTGGGSGGKKPKWFTAGLKHWNSFICSHQSRLCPILYRKTIIMSDF